MKDVIRAAHQGDLQLVFIIMCIYVVIGPDGAGGSIIIMSQHSREIISAGNCQHDLLGI